MNFQRRGTSYLHEEKCQEKDEFRKKKDTYTGKCTLRVTHVLEVVHSWVVHMPVMKTVVRKKKEKVRNLLASGREKKYGDIIFGDIGISVM